MGVALKIYDDLTAVDQRQAQASAVTPTPARFILLQCISENACAAQGGVKVLTISGSSRNR